jgi:hypothetical protein
MCKEQPEDRGYLTCNYTQNPTCASATYAYNVEPISAPTILEIMPPKVDRWHVATDLRRMLK